MKMLNTRKQQVGQEIRSFVNEGMKDVKGNTIYDMNTVFDEIERRYTVEEK